MAQQTCPTCGKLNPAEEAYCYACGAILPAGTQSAQTHALPPDDNLRHQIRWGTAYFGEQTILRIRVRDALAILETRFTEECVIGRTFEDEIVDVDLTEYRAVELGVSRRHVKLTRQSDTVMVQDLGSINGTYLNGQRLIAYQPRVLRNEDELRLGRLVMRVSFMRAPIEDDE